MKNITKLTDKDIADYSYEGEYLLIALETEDEYRIYKTDNFWAWYEVAYPSRCEDYIKEVERNVEGVIYTEKELDIDHLKLTLQRSDMADFINHVTIKEIKANGGWAELIEALRDLDIAA